jgi:hypothetical protein
MDHRGRSLQSLSSCQADVVTSFCSTVPRPPPAPAAAPVTCGPDTKLSSSFQCEIACDRRRLDDETTAFDDLSLATTSVADHLLSRELVSRYLASTPSLASDADQSQLVGQHLERLLGQLFRQPALDSGERASA